MHRHRQLLAALVVLVLISGCGASAPAGTATGSGAGATTTPGNASKGVKFAECMRSHGVGQFPDPGASGTFTIDALANGTSLDTRSPTFTHALSACKELEPAGFMGSPRGSQQQQAALRFAQCIRDNGVSDFPDPLPNGPLVDTDRIPSAAQAGGMSRLTAAMQRCRDAAAAAGVTR